MIELLLKKILFSLLAYVTMFGLYKNGFEHLYCKPSKLLSSIFESGAKTIFTKRGQRMRDGLLRVFDSIFWFLVWISSYRVIKSVEFFKRDEYLLTFSDASHIFAIVGAIIALMYFCIVVSEMGKKHYAGVITILREFFFQTLPPLGR